MELLAAVVAGVSVLLLFSYAMRAARLRPADARLRVLAPLSSAVVEQRGDGEAILRPGGSAIPVIGSMLDRRAFGERWRFELERAGLTLRAGEYFLLRAMLAGIAFLGAAVFLRSPLGVAIGAAAGAGAFMVPALWVRRRVRSRVAAIERQLVETITLIANAQRTGYAFSQGVEVAAQRMGPPISVELNRVLLDINMGAATEDALGAMNQRVGSDDLDLVVTAILIQRQSGGNLAEVLDNVTEIMRDRERIKGEIKTLTASQQLSGWILSCWPLALALLFFAINPRTMSLMWTTLPGVVLLVVWGTLNLLGVLTMRRILNIDI